MKAHVVLAPLSTRLARSQRFAAAREAAREALRASAELAGAPRALPCEDWPRTPAGALAAVRGWHASFADTPGLVVALAAPAPVGIDVEWLRRPRWEAAREHLGAAGELARLGSEQREDVLALWSAKEALLKLAGVGLADLGRCPLLAREGRAGGEGEAETYWLAHAGRRHAVEVRRTGTHVIACALSAPLALAWHALQEVA